jgi:Radical SAM proteins, N-terminal/Radical SAM superfamily
VPSETIRKLIRTRLAAEVGRIERSAPTRVALVYPSPYRVGMSSLGYQAIYSAIQRMPGFACERAFLQDEGDRPGATIERPVTYESLSELGEFPILAVSVAYEGELAGFVRLLDAAGIPALASEREERSPFILAGGPLTFSNPLPLAPFVDAIVMGEGESVTERCLELIRGARSRAEALAALAREPHVFVPAHHGDELPRPASCDDALLPATSVIRTPNTELSNMFLIEAERGCSRGCTYCVMRRSTNGGMRLVSKDTILGKIPADARKVGLVGAAVSDHPRIVDIVRTLAERGLQVGLSSLRPDRLKAEFVEALKLAGYKTLTTALDGPSERLRDLIERRGREPHYVQAAERAKKYGMDCLKLYLMVGLPGETDADIDECVAFVSELSKIVPIALGVAPFCSKRNTPLDRLPFAGVRTVEDRLSRLRRGLKGRADVRPTSARWAWIEWVLAQGGRAEGMAVASAVRAGGTFADYRRAFGELGHAPDGAGYAAAKLPLAPERLRLKRQLSVVGQ